MGFLNGEFSVAVHALVILDRRSGVVTSDELAGNICTNPARVRKVMARLVRAGLAESSEGRGSGYAAPGAGAVTLLQVLDAVGARAVDVAWRTGDMDRDCLISSGMGGAMDALCEELNALCRERLSGITIERVGDRLLREKGGAK